MNISSIVHLAQIATRSITQGLIWKFILESTWASNPLNVVIAPNDLSPDGMLINISEVQYATRNHI